MKFLSLVVCICASLLSACAWLEFGTPPTESVDSRVTDTEQAVEEFLLGRDLEVIEGAWEHDGSAFEVVIARNSFDVAAGYEYVGIITRTDNPMWRQGEIKLLLNNAGAPDVFEGIWMTNNKSRRNMKFVIENRNLIQASFRSNDGNAYFVRIRRINPRLAAVR